MAFYPPDPHIDTEDIILEHTCQFQNSTFQMIGTEGNKDTQHKQGVWFKPWQPIGIIVGQMGAWDTNWDISVDIIDFSLHDKF